MIENNEQWNLNGDCSKCRRSSYCKKECKIHKVNTETFIKDAVRKVTGIDQVEEAMARWMR